VAIPVKLKLNPGASKTLKLKLTIPAGLPAGKHFLSAAIDSTNVIAESNETNNSLITGGTLAIS
jgi:subtilase family serine protease